MKILMAVDSLALPGGIEVNTQQLAGAMAARGHEVDLVYVKGGELAAAYRGFCGTMTQVDRIRYTRVPGPEQLLRIERSARSAAAGRSYDAVLVQHYTAVPFGALVARRTGAVVACQLHAFEGPSRPSVVSLQRAVAVFLPVSEAVRVSWAELGVPLEKLRVLHNGVDPALYPPGGMAERAAARARLGLPPDGFIATYIGRVDPGKGIEVLLDAWREMALPEGDGTLLVVGSPVLHPDPAAYMRRLRAAAPLGCAWLPARADVVGPLHASDLVVLPTPEKETFGRVLIEAMATGRPALGSRVGGIPEVLAGSFGRMLFEPGDVTALAGAIEAFRPWRSSEPGLAEECTGYVGGRFPIERSAATLELELEKVVHAAKPASPTRGRAQRRQDLGPNLQGFGVASGEAGSDGALPPATVVVTTLFSRPELDKCLQTASALDYPDYEVLLVDNRPGAQAPPPPSLAAYPRVRLLHEAHPGISAARNRGLAEARGTIVAFTDDDVTLSPQWLRSLVTRLVEHPPEACATGPVLPPSKLTEVQGWFEAYYGGIGAVRRSASVSFRPGRSEWAGRPGGPSLGRAEFRVVDESGTVVERHPVYGAGTCGSGANVAFWTEALRSLGGFDERLGTGTPARGGEDLAAFVTTLWSGHAIGYAPSAVVWHTHLQYYDQLRKQIRGYGTGYSAMLTSLVLDDPRHLLALALLGPVAAGRFVRSWAGKSRGRRPGSGGERTYFPPELARQELAGLLRGPMAYLRSAGSARRRPFRR